MTPTDKVTTFTETLNKQLSKISSDYLSLGDKYESRKDLLYDTAKELIQFMRQYGDIIDIEKCLFSIDATSGAVSVDFDNSDVLTISKLRDKYVLGEVSNKLQSKLIEYIQENYDKYDILWNREYMYSIIEEKSYDIGMDLIKKEYKTRPEEQEDIVETICKEIDYDEFDDLFEDMINYSSSIEDKLADLGMSQKDFI